MRRILRSPVNSPLKGQWRGALMFTLICARINGWVNNHEVGDFRRHRAHYDIIVMIQCICITKENKFEWYLTNHYCWRNQISFLTHAFCMLLLWVLFIFSLSDKVDRPSGKELVHSAKLLRKKLNSVSKDFFIINLFYISGFHLLLQCPLNSLRPSDTYRYQ